MAETISDHSGNSAYSLKNNDLQQMDADNTILFDQRAGGDSDLGRGTESDGYNDLDRQSGTEGLTNQQAVRESVNNYISEFITNSPPKLIFRGNASTDGQGTYDNDGLAQRRADSVEQVFAGSLARELDERVAAGTMSEGDKNTILAHYNHRGPDGERATVTNQGSVYQYQPGQAADPTDRNAQIYMTPLDGDRAVLETRYSYNFDDSFYSAYGDDSIVLRLESKDPADGVRGDAYAVNQETNQMMRTAHTDIVFENQDGAMRQPVLIKFNAESDFAADKARFIVRSDDPDNVATIMDNDNHIATIMDNGVILAQVRVPEGVSLDSLNIGAALPDNSFEVVPEYNEYDKNDVSDLVAHAQSQEFYNAYLDDALDGKGLIARELSELQLAFKDAAEGNPFAQDVAIDVNQELDGQQGATVSSISGPSQ